MRPYDKVPQNYRTKKEIHNIVTNKLIKIKSKNINANEIIVFCEDILWYLEDETEE